MKVVYFLKSAATGLVKIGRTGNYRQRVRLLESLHGSLELLLLIQDYGTTEEEQHSAFDEHRQGGEWFRFSPAMARHIGAIISGGDVLTIERAMSDVVTESVVTASLPADLYAEAKSLADESGVSLSWIIIQSLRRSLPSIRSKLAEIPKAEGDE